MPITSQEIIEKLDPELKKFLVLSGKEIVEISIDTKNYIHNNFNKMLKNIKNNIQTLRFKVYLSFFISSLWSWAEAWSAARTFSVARA